MDIGVHQDGLVHSSQMSDGFVNNPADVLKVGQRDVQRCTGGAKPDASPAPDWFTLAQQKR